MKNKAKDLFIVDGRFYYGWIIVLLAMMPMGISYVTKTNCASLFLEPLCTELNISRTAYTQTNTVMTVAMLITSIFIGDIFRRFPTKWVLGGCSLLAALCYVLMSRSNALWQLLVLSAIQGIAWAGNTSLCTSIMVTNWFGPKIKGTALSIGMLGSAIGALVWITPVNNVVMNQGWRAGYLVLAAINCITVVLALLVYTKPSDKGYTRRPGDPTPEEAAANAASVGVAAGITGKQALTTARWWFQWFAAFLTMIASAGFAYHCKAFLTGINGGDSAAAAAIYSAALGTLVLGKFLLGVITDVVKIKRSAVFAPLFYAGVFVCLALCTINMKFTSGMIAFYMLGGAVPSVIPFLINARNFGDKEYGVRQGWMIMAGNAGQIVGPTIASVVYDTTGSYTIAWIIFASLMVVVSLFYFISTRISKNQIAEMGYVPVD